MSAAAIRHIDFVLHIQVVLPDGIERKGNNCHRLMRDQITDPTATLGEATMTCSIDRASFSVNQNIPSCFSCLFGIYLIVIVSFST